MENWKVCETDYEISDLGNLSRDGQLIRPRLDKDGYLIATLWVGGVPITRKIHRLVAIAFLENPENKPQVNHTGRDRNGDITKLDNRSISLEWTTPKESIAHGFDNHLFEIGSEKSSAILNEDNVVIVKQMIVDGYGNSEIGRKFGVTSGAIYSIRMNRSWTHVDWPCAYRLFEVTRETILVGDNHKDAKLTTAKVIEIKRALRDNTPISILSKQYNMSGGALRCIRAGTTWKHVILID